MLTIYERIDALCKERGTNVTAMCKELSIARSSLSELSRGRSKTLSADKMSKIAEYFGVSVDYLLGKTDIKKEPTVTVYDEHDNIVRLDDETIQLLDSLRTRPDMKMLFSISSKATPEDVLKAVKIIEALRDESEGK